MKKSVFILLLFFGVHSFLYGQFNGSNGDGFDSGEAVKLLLPGSSSGIYFGGNGDGFTVEESVKNILNNQSLAIYFGGSGDGFSLEQSLKNVLSGDAVSIFIGGNGDGYTDAETFKNLLEGSVVTIFSGGNGDGFSKEVVVKLVLNGGSLSSIFTGGIGDGYATEVRTLYLSPNIKLNVIAFLQGPMFQPNDPGLMNDDLRMTGLIPSTSPYEDEAQVDPNIFNTGGPNGTGSVDDDIVDWVWIELRSDADPTNTLKRRSALIQRDGDIVDFDGISELSISALPGSYYLVVKHRNHLGVMSAIPLAITFTPILVDFTNPATATFGNNAQIQLLTGEMSLWAGDADGDANIKFSGSGNDANFIKDHVLGDPANGFNSVTFESVGYFNSDINMNGNAKFSGAGNDSNILKDNVLAHPENGFGSVTFTIISTVPDDD